MTAPDVGPVGEGWTVTTSYSLVAEQTGGFARRIERALVAYTHELGGRAVAQYVRPLNGGEWQFRDCAAWIACIDPVCRRSRGFSHTLSEPRRISGDELRVLTTDEVALTL